MSRTRIAIAITAFLLTFATASADDKPADKLLGRWALPGKTKQRWEFHTDGTVTGTTNGKPTFAPDNPTGPHLTYAVGQPDEEGNVELTLTLRAADKSADAVYKAKVEFTRQGRITMKYTHKPGDTDRFPPPFPDGKKLYRPEDITD